MARRSLWAEPTTGSSRAIPRAQHCSWRTLKLPVSLRGMSELAGKRGCPGNSQEGAVAVGAGRCPPGPCYRKRILPDSQGDSTPIRGQCQAQSPDSWLSLAIYLPSLSPPRPSRVSWASYRPIVPHAWSLSKMEALAGSSHSKGKGPPIPKGRLANSRRWINAGGTAAGSGKGLKPGAF